MNKLSRYRLLFTISIVAFLAGCSSSGYRNMNMSVQAVNYLNPSLNDLPEPITITAFELKLPNQFKQASYNDLMFNATQTLGSDLIDKESFVIRPSEANHYVINLSSDVKYVGLVASYRQIDQATWREVIQIPDPNSGKLKMLHSNSSISVAINLQTNEMIINQKNSKGHSL